MIILYYESSCTSCRKSINWFKEHSLDIHVKKIKTISKEELLSVLILSENGFEDILKNKKQAIFDLQKKIENIQSASFNDAINLILKFPQVIKLPLIVNSYKIAIGYNTEQFRIFLPKIYRELSK